MPKSTINFDTVRRIGLALPGVEESTAYGSPALKVRGKLLACVPAHRSAEPGSLAVRVGFEDRAELLAAAPDVYLLRDRPLSQLQRCVGSPVPCHTRCPAGPARHGSQVCDRARGTPFAIGAPPQACLIPIQKQVKTEYAKLQ